MFTPEATKPSPRSTSPAGAGPLLSKKRFWSGEALLLLLLVLVLWPWWHQRRVAAHYLQCKWSRIEIAGAVELYNGDNGTRIGLDRPTRLDGKLVELLVSGGYLTTQSRHYCWVAEPQVAHAFVAVPSEERVFCLAHGCGPDRGTAFEQLSRAGVQDPDILRAAYRELPKRRPIGAPRVIFWILGLGGCVTLGLCWLRPGWLPCCRELATVSLLALVAAVLAEWRSDPGEVAIVPVALGVLQLSVVLAFGAFRGATQLARYLSKLAAPTRNS